MGTVHCNVSILLFIRPQVGASNTGRGPKKERAHKNPPLGEIIINRGHAASRGTKEVKSMNLRSLRGSGSYRPDGLLSEGGSGLFRLGAEGRVAAAPH